MKRDDLRAMGIEDTIIDKILDAYHTEVSQTTAELKAAKDEKEALNQQVNELTEKIKQFDGVNLDELKAAPAKIKQDYEKQINEMLKKSAVEKALSGSKHSNLLMGQIDLEKLQVKEGKVVGVDEQVESLKTSYPDLFEAQNINGFKPIKGNVDPSSHKLTKDKILEIKDTAERQKAIAENLDLFE